MPGQHPMTERDLQTAVLDLCKLLGLRTFHTRTARTADGWRTPVEGDGAGFPDLVIVGPAGVLYRELKTDNGPLSPRQRQWLDDLRDAGQDVDVWRPKDLKGGVVERELKFLRGTGHGNQTRRANPQGTVA
jgi:hypothetical protein